MTINATNQVLDQIASKALAERDGIASEPTGECLAAALVRNRADILDEMGTNSLEAAAVLRPHLMHHAFSHHGQCIPARRSLHAPTLAEDCQFLACPLRPSSARSGSS